MNMNLTVCTSIFFLVVGQNPPRVLVTWISWKSVSLNELVLVIWWLGASGVHWFRMSLNIVSKGFFMRTDSGKEQENPGETGTSLFSFSFRLRGRIGLANKKTAELHEAR